MTLHSIQTLKIIGNCIYPGEADSAAWCHAHCMDHQYGEFSLENCVGAGCIHDPDNEESPISNKKCSACGVKSASWDCGYYEPEQKVICWSCMDLAKWAPILRPEQ